MRFFHLNFLNAQGTFAQNIYDVHAIFRQFSDIKMWNDPTNLSVLCQLDTGESQCTGISCPKES